MSRSCSGHEDVEGGALDCGEGGCGLTIIDRGILPPILEVAFHQYNCNRLGFQDSACSFGQILSFTDALGTGAPYEAVSWVRSSTLGCYCHSSWQPDVP